MIGDLIEEIGWFWVAVASVALVALALTTPSVEIRVWLGGEAPREIILRVFAVLSRVLMQH